MVAVLQNLAVYFIIWWVVLFAMLPIGLRTQEEDDDVTLGTTPSAPKGAHMRWAVLRTTLVSAAIFALYFYIVNYSGLTLDDVPRLGPLGG